MRLRLGLLQDTATIEKQAARAAAEAQAKKQKLEITTVKTEAQMKLDEAAAARDNERSIEKAKSSNKPKIRPLSEAKAIDSGATFVSEGFLLLVGISLILLENWRSKRKETSRREDVAERISELEENEKLSRQALVELEKEILRLRAISRKDSITDERILPRELRKLERKEEIIKQSQSPGWWRSWIRWNNDATTSTGSESTMSSEPLKNAPHPTNPSSLKIEPGSGFTKSSLPTLASQSLQRVDKA